MPAWRPVPSWPRPWGCADLHLPLCPSKWGWLVTLEFLGEKREHGLVERPSFRGEEVGGKGFSGKC